MTGSGVEELFEKIVDILVKKGESAANKRTAEVNQLSKKNAGLGKISKDSSSCGC